MAESWHLLVSLVADALCTRKKYMSELTKSCTDGSVACVASVSSGRETNSFSWPRENRASAKKKIGVGGGRGGEEKETLADKPLNYENSS